MPGQVHGELFGDVRTPVFWTHCTAAVSENVQRLWDGYVSVTVNLGMICEITARAICMSVAYVCYVGCHLLFPITVTVPQHAVEVYQKPCIHAECQMDPSAFKQWKRCQCFRSLTCTLMLMNAIAHGTCTAKRVCSGSWQLEKNPLPYWRLEPVSVLLQDLLFDAPPTELHHRSS